MAMMKTGLMVTAALAMAACAPVEEGGLSPDATAEAKLMDASGKPMGRATLKQVGKITTLDIEATGLTPGSHGFHLHSVGRCEGPTFDSAGPHWNPTGKKHGRNNPAGPHAGDLSDLVAGNNGVGLLIASLPNTLIVGGDNPLLDSDGTAIVIHASPDDNVTDPSGNSGARIICGVFKAT